MKNRFDIVVLSHLRWDFVFQRPQQLLSRLATRHRVLYLEEPVDGGSRPDGWEITRPAPGVVVGRPRMETLGSRESGELLGALSRMTGDLVRDQGIESPVAWVYTPMAEPLLDAVDAALVVYDCMDELSLFLGAPPELVRLEAALLSRADLVFTGGASLFEAKRHRHPNVTCLPSSVDAAHFARAARGAGSVAEAPDQAPLGSPRLGFFGVIDERLDQEIVDALAAAHPEWQIVMVGPVVKIDPRSLPARPNIHYFGQRRYDDLPSFVVGWDLCLLPFAMNPSTRFISPTKTLEYMAAERPIVSTPIADVVDAYDHIVYVGAGPDGFLAACETALAAPAIERDAHAARMRAVLARTSWDVTAFHMEKLIDGALAGRFVANY
jgi:UDP-galactopyranose mutase